MTFVRRPRYVRLASDVIAACQRRIISMDLHGGVSVVVGGGGVGGDGIAELE